MSGQAGRVSLSVFNGALFLVMDIARAGPIEPGGSRWLFVIPLVLTFGMAWLINKLINKCTDWMGWNRAMRKPCTAFISLQHILLVSGIVNSMEMIQRSVGMVAGVPLLVFMTMKLHECTRCILHASQCVIEPILVIIVVALAWSQRVDPTSLSPVIPARLVRDARSWDDGSWSRVLGFTILLPLFVVLPSGPMGTVGHWWVGMGPKTYNLVKRDEFWQHVMIRVLIPVITYAVVFISPLSSSPTMPVWAWVIVVLGSVVFGSMDAFGDEAGEKAADDETPHTKKWQTTEMTWAMFSVIMGLCLARPSMQAECFWVRVGIAAVVAWWEMLFGGGHGGMMFLQAVRGRSRHTMMQHSGSQKGDGGAKSMFHGVMVDFGIIPRV